MEAEPPVVQRAVSQTLGFLWNDFAAARTWHGAGIRAILELTHLIVQRPTWNDAAFERACTAVISGARSVGKSMERANQVPPSSTSSFSIVPRPRCNRLPHESRVLPM